MTDREKVLKGLEICARGCSEHCDYWDQRYDRQEILIADALEQLRHQPEIIHCQNCAHFETDHWELVDGIPLIVAHNVCTKWGDGCATSPDGYCFLGQHSGLGQRAEAPENKN